MQMTVSEREIEALVEGLDTHRQSRLDHVCRSYVFDRFIDSNSSHILVVNGNDIQQDAADSLLSILSKRMCVAFHKVRNCVVLSWTCNGEDSHPERMVVNLLGQLLSKSNIALPTPEDGWQNLKFEDLVKILRDCLEVQVARTRVLCVINSVQHYESGEAPETTKQVFGSILVSQKH